MPIFALVAAARAWGVRETGGLHARALAAVAIATFVARLALWRA